MASGLGDVISNLAGKLFGSSTYSWSKNDPSPTPTPDPRAKGLIDPTATQHPYVPAPHPGTAGPLGITAAPSPSPTPMPSNVQQNIQHGFTNFSPTAPPPMATMSAQLAQAGHGLPDPYLPSIVSLLESRGLLDPTPAHNANPYNIFYPGTHQPVNYQNLDQAILGGNGKLGFNGVMHGGIYNDYLSSGKLEDFFKHYSPPGDGNASMAEQIRRYNVLRNLFEPR